MTLRLYLVSTISSETKYLGYDTYDSFVACCKNEDEARRMHPSLNPSTDIFDENEMCWIQEGGKRIGEDNNKKSYLLGGWIYGKDINNALKIELLGTAKKGSEKSVVLASYNAG